MVSLTLPLLLLLAVGLEANSVYDNDDSVLLAKHNTMVHLHEWKWPDIGSECENFLSKHGYGAVQVSPPIEHLFREIDINGQGRKDLPWYVRYQPVSYRLESRSGTEDQFKQMVERCNKADVRVVVDILLNHMAGAGQAFGEWNVSSSGGSFFNSTPNHESFPNANYTKDHFNDYRCDGNIQGDDYNENAANVRNCRLAGLVDLNQGHPHVRSTLAALLNKLIAMGVVGFRLDASKHMWPGDLEAIINMLTPLRSDIFGANKKPFIVHEVIDKGGEAIGVGEYVRLGRYTNFNFGIVLANALQNWDNKNFASLGDLHRGYAYGNLAGHEVVNFVDNHDNQRYEFGHLVTHKKETLYKLAVGYMLAWTYGYPRVMSSYYFELTDQGPPSSGAPKYETTSPSFETDGKCKKESGWVCEHRWPEIRRMVKFREEMGESAVTAIYKEPHILGFARLNKGYFVANNQDVDKYLKNLDTTLKPGNYCDIYGADMPEKGHCTGTVISVNDDGKASFTVPKRSIVAFTVNSAIQLKSSSSTDEKKKTLSRTVIFMKKATNPGEDMFLRGGNPVNGGCETNDKDTKCTIPIVHNTKLDVESDEYQSIIYASYQKWKQGDKFLDFVGVEPRQGTQDGIYANGTPMIWTTDEKKNPAYNALNAEYKLGASYWLVDLLMDCDKTHNGLFEFKATINGSWEPDIVYKKDQKVCNLVQNETTSKNHFAKCGSVNVFTWGDPACTVH